MDEDTKKAKKISDVIDALDGDSYESIGKVWESCYVKNGVVQEDEVKELFCHGCCHSAADGKFPGKPSGERPCMFCIRNKDREDWQKNFKKQWGRELKEWYDGSPIAFYPIDAYTTLDMQEQYDRWERKAKGEHNWNEPRGGIRFG